MGFLDNFFSSNQETTSSSETNQIRDTEIESFLRDLILKSIKTPELQVAGMTDVESAGQDALMSYVRGEDFQDPATSKLYESFRNVSKREEEDAVSDVRRSAQKGGTLHGSSTGRAEGETRTDFSNERMGFLASMLEMERVRNSAKNRGMVGVTAGGLPREIENQQNQANFSNTMLQLAAPFNMQAPIAQNIMVTGQKSKGQSNTTSTPSGFSVASSIAGIAAGGISSGGFDLSNIFGKKTPITNVADVPGYGDLPWKQ